MSIALLTPETSLLLVIDVQERFLAPIWESDRVLARSQFLCKVAALFDIPILASEQYPERMGGTHADLANWVGNPMRKMSFSAYADPEIRSSIEASQRKNIVIVGIETHICVSLTTHDLLAAGYQVVVCPDALSSSTQDRHKLGMERIRDAGGVPAHTEAVAYEWCQTAENSKFREMLNIVKEAQF